MEIMLMLLFLEFSVRRIINYLPTMTDENLATLLASPKTYFPFSVQFRSSVVSDSLRPHEPQLARPPCASTAGVYPNPCPLSQ